MARVAHLFMLHVLVRRGALAGELQQAGGQSRSRKCASEAVEACTARDSTALAGCLRGPARSLPAGQSQPLQSGMSVLIQTTVGDVTVDLNVDDCPNACRNFLQLCKHKKYNNCLFFNVQPGFIAQTGDPTGTGHGGEACRW